MLYSSYGSFVDHIPASTSPPMTNLDFPIPVRTTEQYWALLFTIWSTRPSISSRVVGSHGLERRDRVSNLYPGNHCQRSTVSIQSEDTHPRKTSYLERAFQGASSGSAEPASVHSYTRCFLQRNCANQQNRIFNSVVELTYMVPFAKIKVRAGFSKRSRRRCHLLGNSSRSSRI